MSDNSSTLSNKDFNRFINDRNAKDENDLLVEVDKAGPLGYKLPNTGHPDCIRFLLASYRLCSNSDMFGRNIGLILQEREPYVLVRKTNKDNSKET